MSMGEEHSKRVRILCIDDDPHIRLLVSRVLEKTLGWVVEEAPNGEVALARLGEGAPLPDLILLDVMMPGENGLNVGRRIKSTPEWSHIPIVFLTAGSSENAADLESCSFISKPFGVRDLGPRLVDVLHNTQVSPP